MPIKPTPPMSAELAANANYILSIQIGKALPHQPLVPFFDEAIHTFDAIITEFELTKP